MVTLLPFVLCATDEDGIDPLGSQFSADRSFVETMATDPDSDAIVRALIGLGAGLGLQVIAEGVENEEQPNMAAIRRKASTTGQLYPYPTPCRECRWR